MYDTIKLWLPKDLINDSRYLQKVPTTLTNVKATLDKETNQYYETGLLNNLYIAVSEAGVSVTGSLNKYFHNENTSKINRQQTQEAIEKLNDETTLNFNNANVKKLELANNFIVNEKVENYYYFLGNCQHYSRLEQENSIYYKNDLRQLLFYDKVAECKKNKCALP